MRRFALLTCAMSVALACLVRVQLTAHADSHRLPEAVLMKGEKELQKGLLGTYCWLAFGCGDSFFLFPDPGTTARVTAGSTLHIRIKYAEEPPTVGVSRHRLNQRGEMVGRSRSLAISLQPVVQDGQTVAWDAFFSVKRPDRHYYLTPGAYWGEGRHAMWGFHVQTRRDS
jgi:hypothetical protein